MSHEYFTLKVTDEESEDKLNEIIEKENEKKLPIEKKINLKR